MLILTDKPSPPQNLKIREVSKNYMWVTWEMPESDGGCPVQEYVVEKRDARKTNYTNAGTVNADTHELQVENVKF